MDAVTAVVAALVRPGRVLRAGAQLHPHGDDKPLGKIHHRVRRPVGQRKAEGDPRIRARRHPPVRAPGPRRPDRQAARRNARSRQAHRAEAARPGRGGPPQAHARPRVRRARTCGTSPPNSASTTASRGSSRSPSPTPSSPEAPGSRATTPRRSTTRWAARSSKRATSRSPGRSRSSRRQTPLAGRGRNRAAVVHVICAAPQFTDKGKVALVVPAAVADRARAALDKTTKVLRKEARKRRKDASKAGRRARDVRQPNAGSGRTSGPSRRPSSR